MVATELYLLGAALLIVSFAAGYGWAWLRSRHRFEDAVEERKEKALKQSRAVIGGKVAEQMSPVIPGFPGKVSEARFLGDPIDYVVFDGLDEKDISRVSFVEVKSGGSHLSGQERHLRDAVQAGNVRWVEHRVNIDT